MHEADLLFNAERQRLQALAYRMLGSGSEADDVVQEAWLRWHEQASASITDPRAYWPRIVTHLSIDALRRARRAREVYAGPWLPEPLPPEAVHANDGEASVAFAQTVSVALLLALETLAVQVAA